jgi:non-ribosomal peptide synthetase component F
VEGKESGLEELKIQYADYAQWQREWLKGEVLEEQLGYWRNTLAGAQDLELPGDWPRPAVLIDDGETLAFEMSAELTQSLKQLARREGVTTFMALLAGFQVVFGLYAGRDEVVIGTDVANRHFKQTEALIGFFVNQLVMRTSLAGDSTFRELLGRVQKTALEAYAHQDLPFERVVEDLAPKRSLDRSPLFQVKMVFQNVPEQSLHLSGVQLELWRDQRTVARFDLTLTMHERQSVLVGAFNYRTGLFKPETIHLLKSQFVSLLEAVVKQPEVRLSDLQAELASAIESFKIESNRRIERLLEKKLMTGKRKIVKTGAL